MKPLGIILLAAGLGKRMMSDLPKVLHYLGGRPLILYPLRIAQSLEPQRVAIVVGNGAEAVRQLCGGDGFTWVTQHEQLGTGHAVLCAAGCVGTLRALADWSSGCRMCYAVSKLFHINRRPQTYLRRPGGGRH